MESVQSDSYVGELQKPRGGGPIFFSRGGLIFKNREGQRGGLQKFSLKFHRVIQINKNRTFATISSTFLPMFCL